MISKRPTLGFCVLMDLLGCVSYIFPAVEWVDVVWAPVSAIIFYYSFGKRKAAFGALFNFAEELLPFTDVIPTFTIAWVWNYLTIRQSDNSTIRQ